MLGKVRCERTLPRFVASSSKVSRVSPLGEALSSPCSALPLSLRPVHPSPHSPPPSPLLLSSDLRLPDALHPPYSPTNLHLPLPPRADAQRLLHAPSPLPAYCSDLRTIPPRTSTSPLTSGLHRAHSDLSHSARRRTFRRHFLF